MTCLNPGLNPGALKFRIKSWSCQVDVLTVMERACINFATRVEHYLIGLKPSGIATPGIYPSSSFSIYKKKNYHFEKKKERKKTSLLNCTMMTLRSATRDD